jgi:cystinosin
VFLNYQRKSVVGLSFDFIFLNLLGFACYTAFNCALFYNTDIRTQYAQKYNGSTPSVAVNDVFFAIHAVVLTAINVIQIGIYDRGQQRISRLCIVVLLILFALIGVITGLAAKNIMTWLSYLDYLGYIKLAISIMKVGLLLTV